MNNFDHPEFAKHERVVFINDASSGLKAIIAVHNTQRGPAIGGCRMWPYTCADAALTDVLRLSRGMTYKNALAGINSGGGKSVIIGNTRTDKTPERLKAMAKAIGSLGGMYIAAEDSGTSPDDMAVMAEVTPFVAGLESEHCSGDPSPSTALGVYLSIREAVNFQLGQSDLSGVRVNVQGLGKVGYALAQLLANDGAQVIASDINEDNCERARNTLAIETVSNDELITRGCEVFAPCALGGVLNENTIPHLKTHIVAGAANNQLLTDEDFDRLHAAGILYCPDYLISAGGVVDVYQRRHGGTQADIDQAVAAIAIRLNSVLSDAKLQAVSPEIIARARAEALINDIPDTPVTTRAA